MADQYGNNVDGEIWVPKPAVTLEPGEWVISKQDIQAMGTVDYCCIEYYRSGATHGRSCTRKP